MKNLPTPKPNHSDPYRKTIFYDSILLLVSRNRHNFDLNHCCLHSGRSQLILSHTAGNPDNPRYGIGLAGATDRIRQISRFHVFRLIK